MPIRNPVPHAFLRLWVQHGDYHDVCPTCFPMDLFEMERRIEEILGMYPTRPTIWAQVVGFGIPDASEVQGFPIDAGTATKIMELFSQSYHREPDQ